MNEFEKMDPMSHENLGSLLAYHDHTIHKLYDKIDEALKTCDDLIKHIDQIVNENADLEKRLDAIEKHILDEAGCEENTQDCYDELMDKLKAEAMLPANMPDWIQQEQKKAQEFLKNDHSLDAIL